MILTKNYNLFLVLNERLIISLNNKFFVHFCYLSVYLVIRFSLKNEIDCFILTKKFNFFSIFFKNTLFFILLIIIHKTTQKNFVFLFLQHIVGFLSAYKYVVHTYVLFF